MERWLLTSYEGVLGWRVTFSEGALGWCITLVGPRVALNILKW